MEAAEKDREEQSESQHTPGAPGRQEPLGRCWLQTVSLMDQPCPTSGNGGGGGGGVSQQQKGHIGNGKRRGLWSKDLRKWRNTRTEQFMGNAGLGAGGRCVSKDTRSLLGKSLSDHSTPG